MRPGKSWAHHGNLLTASSMERLLKVENGKESETISIVLGDVCWRERWCGLRRYQVKYMLYPALMV